MRPAFALVMLAAVVAALAACAAVDTDSQAAALAAYAVPASNSIKVAAATAADASALHVWPGAPPGDIPGTFGPESVACLTPNTPVADCKDRGFYNVTTPTLTPYLVPNATSAVVVAPGGAYHELALDREGTDIAAWLNSAGVSAFLLKYRVPERPNLAFGGAALMDAQRAVGLVRQMAADGSVPNLNASRVGFMGFSAGAHLTGHMNVAWQHRAYPRVDAADDLPCRPDFSMMIYPWQSVVQDPVRAPPDEATAPNVTAAAPPTMLVQAEDDPVHMENALFYFLALKDARAPASELHIYPRGGHGYGRCTVNGGDAGDEVCTWPDRGQRFMQTLGVAPQQELTRGGE